MTIRRAMGDGRGALVLLIGLLTPFSFFPSAYAESGYLAQEAQRVWKNRDKPGQTEAAIQLWTQAVRAEPNRGELWVNLSKGLGRSVRHAKTSKERRHYADQARAAAEKAVQISPASAEAFAAYVEALGQWANARKGVRSLSTVRQAVQALQKAIALNPQYAYAHMLLAEFYRQSPRLFSIGDKKKALAHARLAVEWRPGYAIHHLVLARALLDLGKKEEGIAELQKIGTLTAPLDAVPETRADQETALAMLRELGIASVTPSRLEATPPSPQCGEAGGFCSETPQP